MNWILSVVRVVGASFPGAASLVQAQAEIDSRSTQERLRNIEDPLSALHPDVREVTADIYHAIRTEDRSTVEFPEQLYERYARVLAILEAHGCISGTHVLGKRFAAGFSISDPQFLLYMTALHEDPVRMDRLVELIEQSPRGRWLKGAEIARDFGVPVQTVRALFEVYHARGLGILSNEDGTANYRCLA